MGKIYTHISMQERNIIHSGRNDGIPSNYSRELGFNVHEVFRGIGSLSCTNKVANYAQQGLWRVFLFSPSQKKQ